MKSYIIYRKNSEDARLVEEFLFNLKKVHNLEPEIIDQDSREADNKLQVYGLTKFPAILIVDDNGPLQKSWEGEQMPLINDFFFYVNS